jgi:putative transposase
LLAHPVESNARGLDDIAVDAIGLVLTVLVTAASVQGHDAAKPLLWNLRTAFLKVKLA